MRRKSNSYSLALGAVLSALALSVLGLSALVPAGRWGLVAVAGLFPVAAVIATGLKGGLGVWAAAGLLGLLLLPDKLNAILYLILFGLYPVVKSLLERGRIPRWLSILGKLCFFNAVAGVLVLAFDQMFLPVLPEELKARLYLVFILGSVVFLVYDFGLSKLIALYLGRVGRAVDRGGK